MRLHFFSVRNIDDYRKVYMDSPIVKKIFENSPTVSTEDVEQYVFYGVPENVYRIPQGILESRIVGETNIAGLRLDFNFGLRLDIPEGNFRVKISDADTGQIFFDKYISGGRLLSVEQYFVRWHVEIFLNGERILNHTLNLEGQPVAIMFKDTPIGDALALLPFAREFKKRHRCNLSICLPNHLRELAAHLYPDLEQINGIDFRTYATYYLYMVMSSLPLVPVDARNMPMERVGGTLLGIANLPPKATFKPTAPPVTSEPYVCIGVQASSTKKGWLYPRGWDIIVDYLKQLGYRVFCIDKRAQETNNGFTITKPDGAEDFTGNFSLVDRANMLYHAEFFVGLSSGLSWIAEAVNCPVVMICGFSQDWFEFYTPYRVSNRLVCNGCLTDIRASFMGEFCPYHEGTSRELECQKKIYPSQVINAIERLILDRHLTPPALK